MTIGTRESDAPPRDAAPRPGADPDPNGWRQEGHDLARGVAAGSIVGLPLLYTMEMWWRGMTAAPGHLLALLGATLLINFVFCLLSGFRAEYSVAEAASESVSSVGMGLLFSLAVLWLIGEVDAGATWGVILGQVVIETAPVSLGISFANAQLRGRSRMGDDDGDGGEGRDDAANGDPDRRQLRQDLKDVGVTLAGATVFAFNVAPTEEVITIAARLAPWQHLLVMAASLGLCYLILFASGFDDERTVHVPSPFQRPAAETVMAYATSLAVAFVLLVLVGVPEATANPTIAVQCTVTLGLVATVGGAAGRLIT